MLVSSHSELTILGVIPARYGSTRFPAKALAQIYGKPMVQHVYERCLQAKLLDKVVVATDHALIFEAVKRFGGDVVMTSEKHPSGTDRVQEAYTLMERPFDYIINIQGDEPFINPEQIDLLADLLVRKQPQIGTLVKAFYPHDESLFRPNTAKVLISNEMRALYFSRQVVPFLRDVPLEQWAEKHTYYRHIGIYAYSAQTLSEITRLEPSNLEKAESLEQLRWLENGYPIDVAITTHDSHGIDTPEDLERVTRLFAL